MELFALTPIKKKPSKQFNICSQCWHEVTPLAQLLRLFCSGHNYDIFPWMMFVRVRAAERGAEFPQRQGQTVFGHLTPTWVIGPLLHARSTPNKPAKESLFVLKGSTNRRPVCWVPNWRPLLTLHRQPLRLWQAKPQPQIYRMYCLCIFTCTVWLTQCNANNEAALQPSGYSH